MADQFPPRPPSALVPNFGTGCLGLDGPPEKFFIEIPRFAPIELAEGNLSLARGTSPATRWYTQICPKAVFLNRNRKKKTKVVNRDKKTPLEGAG